MTKQNLNTNPIRLEGDWDDAVAMWMAGLFMVPMRNAKATRTLLVLEDESLVMNLLRNMLKEQYTVIEATSAEQAFQEFNYQGHLIDLLVADLSLPTSSGIQVALRLRSQIPGLPVILTSGYPVGSWSYRDSADLETLGSTSVTILQKPFQVHKLLNAVRELLGAPRSFHAGSSA
jgi:DNA-binding response OmpR family regulator